MKIFWIKIYPQFPKGGNLNNSIGKIIEINSFTFDFSHSASTEQGSSGSPIFLFLSIYVIVIHDLVTYKIV